MRKFLMIMLASTAGLAMVGGAEAADAVSQIPQAPVAVDTPAPVVSNWAGAYVGGEGTYTWSRSGGPNLDGHALGGALYGGYNWQTDKIVYGAEADMGYAGGHSDASDGYSGKEGWNGSIRGRLGYDLSPFMVYGTAGLAAADTKISNNVGSDSKTAFGYTVGAGVEAMVTKNITTRIEYRYTNYGNKNYDIGNTSVSRGFDDQSVKVGIGVKF
ncbi:porin family protein [Allorhizobium sp. BGMRC 0089]|uniref:outer membrane protein n=1 Tax=Allorhizobium sonneratiae TaxID=2934936 RepID=UPI0020337A5A|nr:outer membrane protein [Allorhizobium sonneratiae]MCM2292080.1 porin family protein [Allorhizobium sonneratiae]